MLSITVHTTQDRFTSSQCAVLTQSHYKESPVQYITRIIADVMENVELLLYR